MLISAFALSAVSATAANSPSNVTEMPSGIVVYRTKGDVSVKRGDILNSGDTITTTSNAGRVSMSLFPGGKAMLKGRNVSATIGDVFMRTSGGYVTEQDAAIRLDSGTLTARVNNPGQGASNRFHVAITQGIVEIDTSVSTKFVTALGIIADEANPTIACYEGIVHFVVEHGVPTRLHPEGTKPGDKKEIIPIPAGFALRIKDYLDTGVLLPVSDLNQGTDPDTELPSDLDSSGDSDFDTPDNFAPGVNSPSH